MINDKVSIFNLALNAIGARNNVSSPDENSREAEVCRLWYSPVVDQVLASAPWPSARAFSRLALLKERDFDEDWVTDDPEPEFRFVYSVPSDILRPRYLSNYNRFTIASYPGDVKALMTNEEAAILVYTKRQENIALWDSELQMAIVYALASNICSPLTGKPQRSRSLLEQANNLVFAAREGAANTNEDQRESIPDWILARGYGGGWQQFKYLYPYGPLLSVITNVN